MVVCKIFMSIRTTVSKRYILPTGLFFVLFCFDLFCFVALLIESLTVGERSKCFVPTLKNIVSLQAPASELRAEFY